MVTNEAGRRTVIRRPLGTNMPRERHKAILPQGANMKKDFPKLRPKRAKALAPRAGSTAERVVKAFDAGAKSVNEIVTGTKAGYDVVWRTLQRWRPDWRNQLWQADEGSAS